MKNSIRPANSLPRLTNSAIIKSTLERHLGIRISTEEISHRNTKRTVNSRLSRRERRQQQRDAYLGARPAGVDKADGYFHQAVVIEDVKRRAKELGLPIAYERLGKGRKTHALRIGARDNYHVYLHLYRVDSQYSRKFLTNPKYFPSVVEYTNFLIQLFGLNQYESLTLYRLDFHVDLNISFNEVKKMLRVRHKQINRHNSNRGCELNYILFGGGDCVIAVYNKTKELQDKGIDIDTDITRIEIRLTSKAVPVSLLCELSNLASLKNGRPLDPFNRVSLEPVTLRDIDTVRDRKTLIKLVRLQTLMEAEGFDYAHRFLNKNDNFKRDYQGLISYSESPVDLNKLFHDNLADFMRKPRFELL